MAGEKINGSANLSFSFPSASSAKAAYSALLAEADFSHRGESKVSLSGKSVLIKIIADDPVSMRASLNSYLRLMGMIKSIDDDEKE